MLFRSLAALALPALALSQDILTAPSEVMATPTPAQPVILSLSQQTQSPSTFETSFVPASTDKLEYATYPTSLQSYLGN